MEAHDYGKCLEKWEGHMLNCDAAIVALKHIKYLIQDGRIKKDAAFYRPSGDNKNFSGGVHDFSYMEELLKNVLALKPEETFYGLNPDTMIVCAPPTEIYSEYRTWVIDGKVITASQYKTGDRVSYTSIVDDDVLEFAQRMANIWQPDQAFVLDVCRSERGLCVLEINTLNAAGFYAADMFKIFQAVEALDSAAAASSIPDIAHDLPDCASSEAQ